MKKKEIVDLVESSFLQLGIIFIILVFLKELGYTFGLNFKLFAYILALLSISVLVKLKRAKRRKLRHVSLILFIIISTVFASRIIPSLDSQVPLGYDPGFYRHIIDLYRDSLPDIPEESLPLWIKFMYPQGLFILTSILQVLTNISSDHLLLYFFPFLCAFLTLPLFILARSLFCERTAIIASMLYAASLTQYAMFTHMFFKNVIGLILLLLALYSLEKRSYIPLTLIFAGLGIYHRPEFFLFSLILVPYFIRVKDIKIVYSGVGAALLILPFWLPRLDIYLRLISNLLRKMPIKEKSAAAGGTFFEYSQYEEFSLAYLPFALMGFLYLAMKKKYNSLFFYFIINVAIVIFRLIFFRRFIIPLDLLFVILAGAGIGYALLESEKVSRKLGTLALATLLISSGLLMFDQAFSARPLIDEDALETIKWLDNNLEEDAFIIAPSNVAPWVLGYTSKRVIAPGLFEYDLHKKEEWTAFFYNEDIDKTKEFLGRYDKPLYIFRPSGLGKKKFENECFNPIKGDILKYVC